MTNVLGIPLHDGEERCAVIRCGARVLLPKLLLGVVWVLVPFFFFFPLLRMGLFGLLLAGVLAVSGLLYLRRVRGAWYHTALVATTTRIIDVSWRGSAAPRVVAVPWRDVSVVRVEPRSVLHTLLGIGTIRVDFVESHRFSFVLFGVRTPERVQQLLHEVQYLKSRGKREEAIGNR